MFDKREILTDQIDLTEIKDYVFEYTIQEEKGVERSKKLVLVFKNYGNVQYKIVLSERGKGNTIWEENIFLYAVKQYNSIT